MENFSLETDMMLRQVQVPENPQRIVSLVPSQTELLFDLGLGEKVVGVTNFCIHPKEEVRKKVKIGGTKKFDFSKIQALQPDLIIGNKEENYQEGIEQLAQQFPVWMSDIENLEQALEMTEKLGKLVKAENRASAIKKDIEQGFSALATQKMGTAAYLIWRKPYMAAGRNTFITDLLARAGFDNVFAGQESRYPEVTVQMLQNARPDFVFLSSEPYPFSEKHFTEFQSILPESKVLIVDGELFSWYGSRLLKTPAYLTELTAMLKK